MARGYDVDVKVSNAFNSRSYNIEETARYLVRLPNLVIQAIDVSNKKYAREQEDPVG